MKRLKILLLTSFLFILLLGNAYASNINEINIVDEKNIDFVLSEDVVLPQGNLNSDIKFLKDIEVVFASKDFDDQNKLILNLATDLEINKTYSLLTILGPEANMDFTTGVSLENYEIQNNVQTVGEEQGLNRIYIKNLRTLELYFNSVIEEDEFEFKLLNELKIESISPTGINKISLKLEDKLEKLSDYLVMVLYVKNNFGNEISFDEDLYELKTTDQLNSSETQNEEKTEEPKIEKINDEEEPKLNNLEGEIEDVALNSAETPDTGPETTVLILLTFILNTALFIRKKIL